MDLKKYIRNIPDFPKKGILFRDITPLLSEPKAFKTALDKMEELIKDKKIDTILAAEARGFIFGGALALKLKCSFAPVRKKGKLPYKTYETSYSLEYGKDTLEIHQDALEKGKKVLIVDDLLATGGTTKALVDLARKLGGEIAGCLFLIELSELDGRKNLENLPVYSLLKY